VSPLQSPETDEFLVERDKDELVYRHITAPLLSPDTRTPSSSAFGPKPIDKGKPSFIRSALVPSAQDARDWHTAHAAKPSLGVWACSVSEVIGTGTQTIDDSAVTPPDGEVVAPGHCFVDYRHLNKSDERKVRSLLLAFAIGRKELATTAA